MFFDQAFAEPLARALGVSPALVALHESVEVMLARARGELAVAIEEFGVWREQDAALESGDRVDRLQKFRDASAVIRESKARRGDRVETVRVDDARAVVLLARRPRPGRAARCVTGREVSD